MTVPRPRLMQGLNHAAAVMCCAGRRAAPAGVLLVTSQQPDGRGQKEGNNPEGAAAGTGREGGKEAAVAAMSLWLG